MRWSIADGVVKDRDGENEDGEQRILFETGGDGDDCKSSKKLDLLPHTTADMLRQKKKSNSSQQQQQQQQFFSHRLAHTDSKNNKKNQKKKI